MDSLVVPCLASSFAFSFPHNPICAAFQRISISRVLVDPSALRESQQSLVVLLRVESEEIACIELEERLSDHMMI